MDTANDQALPNQKTLQVGTAQRTIHARTVTIICQHCGITVTRLQYPGYPPRYCSPDCKRAVHRVRDQQRKAAQRAGHTIPALIATSDTLAQESDSPPPPPPVLPKAPKFIGLRGETREVIEAKIRSLRVQYGDQLFFSEPVESLPHQWRSFGARLPDPPADSAVDAAGRGNPGSSPPIPALPAAASLDDDEEW
jgi:hypothetical protein